MPDALHDGAGIPIGNPYHRADIDIRRHRNGAVRIARHRGTQDGCVIMFVKQRKFQRIIKEILVVFNVQVFPVDIICRYPVQLLQDGTVGFRHTELPAKGLPARNVDGLHMEIIAAVKQNQYGFLRKSTPHTA